jgi:uncharacterized protein YecE (DUF72 family)
MDLLNYYRGLIIVEPYGTYIKKKLKTIIVKSKHINSITNEKLLLIENKEGLGIIELATPIKINLKEFSKLRKYHKITEDEREKWWPKYKYLYSYKIIKSKFFKIPLLLDYPLGPQITVIPDNITIKKILIGMSGYYYRNMYPKGTKNILNYYSQKLNSVEINSTFYNFPPQSSIDNLKKYNLIYSIKVNKYITHNKKLKDIDQYWNNFYNTFEPIYDKIFCFLFQFSPKFYFNDENYQRLKKLSKILNKNHYYAFEFRDLSWFENEKINNFFTKNKWIIVIVNVNNSTNWAGNLQNGFNPPLKYYQMTSDCIYIRMHGTIDKYRGPYNNNIFKEIFNYVKKRNLRYVFIYFNNTDSNKDAFEDSQSLMNKFNWLNKEFN